MANKHKAGIVAKSGVRGGEHEVSHNVYVKPNWFVNWGVTKFGTTSSNPDEGKRVVIY